MQKINFRARRGAFGHKITSGEGRVPNLPPRSGPASGGLFAHYFCLWGAFCTLFLLMGGFLHTFLLMGGRFVQMPPLDPPLLPALPLEPGVRRTKTRWLARLKKYPFHYMLIAVPQEL